MTQQQDSLGLASLGVRALALIVLAAPACTGKGNELPEMEEQVDTGADSDVVADTGDDDDQSSTGGLSDVDEGGSTGEGDTGCNFICDGDTGPDHNECDQWAQDCPDGEKCMPWANDGGSSWNALRCAPVADSPNQPGDACMVEGSGVSGIDDCVTGAMCWDVDENGEGTCVPMCTGSGEAPLCDNPTDTCVIANDGVLSLCLPSCDPLLQDCAEGSACYGTVDAFACAPDASGPDLGSYGDPCEFTNTCDPGLFCAGAAAVPNCAGSQGCCSEFCDLDAPNPDEACGGSALGQSCEPWFVEGAAPPGYESLGACVLPE